MGHLDTLGLINRGGIMRDSSSSITKKNTWEEMQSMITLSITEVLLENLKLHQ